MLSKSQQKRISVQVREYHDKRIEFRKAQRFVSNTEPMGYYVSLNEGVFCFVHDRLGKTPDDDYRPAFATAQDIAEFIHYGMSKLAGALGWDKKHVKFMNEVQRLLPKAMETVAQQRPIKEVPKRKRKKVKK